MRKYLLGSPILLLLSSLLYAEEFPSSNQGKEATGMVNPSSRYQVENGWNIFLDTQFLWWIAKGDGLYYAQAGANPPLFDGHLHKVKSHFRPGFRLALGGNMEYDEWDILLSWTWFQSNARDHANGSLLPLWATPGVFGPLNASSAKAHWWLHYNILDVEMGRSFWVGRHFSLRPFLGIRGGWIDQHLTVRYDYVTTPETDGKIRAHSDFEGVGVRAGIDMRFALLHGWSFYGIASASMLYGFYDCFFHEQFESQKIAEARDGFRNALSSGQLALGLRWDTYVHKDRYHFGLYAGWEQNIWFGLNKMNHFMGTLDDGNLEQMNGDIALAGGTFGVRFDF